MCLSMCLFICLFIMYLFLHVSTIFYFHCIWHKTHATLWLWAKCSDQRVCVQKNMGTAGLRWVIKFHQQQTKGISSTAPPAPTAQRNPEEVHPNFPGRCVVWRIQVPQLKFNKSSFMFSCGNLPPWSIDREWFCPRTQDMIRSKQKKYRILINTIQYLSIILIRIDSKKTTNSKRASLIVAGSVRKGLKQHAKAFPSCGLPRSEMWQFSLVQRTELARAFILARSARKESWTYKEATTSTSWHQYHHHHHHHHQRHHHHHWTS
jgi:hypothetical protein